MSALLLFLAMQAHAGTGEAFLKVPVGAREAALGGAFTGVADNADSLFWNPAGLASLGRQEFSATHAQLFAGMNYEFAAYALPTRWGTFGVSGSYLSKGKLDGRDANGAPTGTFTGTDAAFGVGFGRTVSRLTDLGGQVKFVRSSIADVSATGVAFDLGVTQRTGFAGLQFGLAVRNLGPGMKFLDQTTALPTTVALGASYALFPGVTVSAEATELPEDDERGFAVGAQYDLFSALSVRGGYSGKVSGPAAAGSSGLEALTGAAGGLGLRVGRFSLDYSFTPFGELGSVQRLSVGGRF